METSSISNGQEKKDFSIEISKDQSEDFKNWISNSKLIDSFDEDKVPLSFISAFIRRHGSVNKADTEEVAFFLYNRHYGNSLTRCDMHY